MVLCIWSIMALVPNSSLCVEKKPTLHWDLISIFCGYTYMYLSSLVSLFFLVQQWVVFHLWRVDNSDLCAHLSQGFTKPGICAWPKAVRLTRQRSAKPVWFTWKLSWPSTSTAWVAMWEWWCHCRPSRYSHGRWSVEHCLPNSFAFSNKWSSWIQEETRNVVFFFIHRALRIITYLQATWPCSWKTSVLLRTSIWPQAAP